MMRRIGDRFRTSWTALIQGELEGVRTELTTSWTHSFDELRREIVAEHEVAEARAAEHDHEVVHALHRVADAFESIAASLESDRRDRREQLDAVEFLLREMVLGSMQPTAARPVVEGGTIDPELSASGLRAAVDIDLSDLPISVGTIVEVRSRFHDQWVHGFAVGEYIPGPTRRGYRLRRITDTEQLPLLFDAADVRRAVIASDQPAIDHTGEPEPSIWR
jgi:hypothetical protein